MSQELLIKEEVKVEVKESFGGFSVIHPDSCSYDSCEDAIRRMTKKQVSKFETKELAKKDFERMVLRDYKAKVEWRGSKFQDSKGVFYLDGVAIRWELESHSMCNYHFDIYSYLEENKHLASQEYTFLGYKGKLCKTGRVPNSITETGYKSCFAPNLDAYDSINQYWEDRVDYELNTDYTGKRNKKIKEFDLSFEKPTSQPKRQLTLLELQGGVNK